MRDHNSGNLRIGQKFVAALGKLEQHFIGHVVGADLHDLFAGDIGKFFDSRNSVNQRLNGEVTGLVTGHLSAGSSGTGNRAARGENGHIGQLCSKSAACQGQSQGGCKQSLFHN